MVIGYRRAVVSFTSTIQDDFRRLTADAVKGQIAELSRETYQDEPNREGSSNRDEPMATACLEQIARWLLRRDGREVPQSSNHLG